MAKGKHVLMDPDPRRSVEKANRHAPGKADPCIYMRKGNSSPGDTAASIGFSTFPFTTGNHGTTAGPGVPQPNSGPPSYTTAKQKTAGKIIINVCETFKQSANITCFWRNGIPPPSHFYICHLQIHTAQPYIV